MQKQTKDKLKKAVPLALGSSMMVLSLIPAAAAFAATNNFISNVQTHVSGKTVSATSNHGHLNVWYQFRVTAPNGHMWIQRRFGSSASMTWVPPGLGTYHVQAFALTQWQVAHKQWNKAVSGTAVADIKVTTATISMNSTLPALTAGGKSTDTATLTVINSNGTVGANETVSLSSSDSSAASVPSSVTTNSNGTATFIVTPGTKADSSVTITATLGKATATTTVDVKAGAPAAVKLTPASPSLVADGVATDAITATVVDANGNPVSAYNGPVNVWVYGDTVDAGIATSTTANNVNDPTAGAPMQLTATNGQVTLSLDSTNYVPSPTTQTITVYAQVPNTGSPASQTFGLTAPTASQVVVQGPKFIASSASPSEFLVNPVVEDSNGAPIEGANYQVSLSLTGPATFFDGTKGPELASYPGGYAYIQPDPSGIGTIQVTATVTSSGGTTLTSVPLDVTMGTPGTASQLALTDANQLTTNLTADDIGYGGVGAVFNTYTLQPTDASGIPSTGSAPATVNATVLFNGKPSTAIGVVGATNANNYTVSESLSNGSYQVPLTYLGGGSIPAGTYTLQVTGQGLSTYTATFNVAAGAPNVLSVTPSTTPTDLSVANPSTQVVAQVQDNWGNNVDQAGIPINFSSSGNVTLDGNSAAADQAFTNANGAAMVTADEPATVGDTGKVSAAISSSWATANGYPAASGASGELEVVPAMPAAIKISVPAQPVPEGDTPTISYEVTDASGAPLAGDTITWTVLGPNGSIVASSSGVVTAQAVPNSISAGSLTAAGTYTVKVTDESVPSLSQSATFSVGAGTFNGFALFDSSGNVVSGSTSLKAGQTETLTLKPVDSADNPVSAPDSFKVTLPTVSNAVFTLPGSTEPITTVNVPVGSDGVAVNLTGDQSDTTGSVTVGAASQNPLATTAVFSPAVTALDSGFYQAEVLTVEDSTGTALAGQSVTLTAEASGGGTPQGYFLNAQGLKVTTLAVTTNGQGQVAFNYYAPSSINAAASDVISAAVAGSALSGTGTVNYGSSATAATLSSSSSVTAGIAQSYTIKLNDPSYTGTATLAWTGATASPNSTKATLPTTATFKDGVATVSGTLVDAGTANLGVAVSGIGAGTINSTADAVTVNAGTAAGGYVSSVTPSGTTLGTPVYGSTTAATQALTGLSATTYTVTVQAVDVYGNKTTTGSSIDVAFAAGQNSTPAADGNTLSNGGASITSASAQTLSSGTLTLTYTVSSVPASTTPDTITISPASGSGITDTVSGS